MAITRQDYKYVHNTLAKSTNKQDDGVLKIGSVVNNLITELSKDTVYNPQFTSFYGNRDLANCWSSAGVVAKESKIVTTIKPEDWIDNTILDGMDMQSGTLPYLIQGEVVNLDEASLSMRIYLTKTPIQKTIFVTSNIGVSPNWSYNLKGNYVSVTLSGPAGCSYRVWVSYKVFGYSYKQTIELTNQNIISATVESSATIKKEDKFKYTLTWSEYEKPIKEVNKTIKIKTNELTSSANIVETINNGKLSSITNLSKNTTYVLQVVNAARKYNTASDNEIISTADSNQKFSCGDYFFFHTGSVSGSFEFIISGISFGYKIYHPTPDKTDGTFIELRAFSVPNEAKVFLFKSNLPWVVDEKGTIVGLSDQKLQFLGESKDATDKKYRQATLSTEEIKSIFSTAPVIETKEKGIQINVEGSTVDSWKYKALIETTQKNGSKEVKDFIKNLKLLIYRDFLIDEVRVYNKLKYTTSKALIHTIYNRTKLLPRDSGSSSGKCFINIYPAIDLKEDSLNILTMSLNNATISRESKRAGETVYKPVKNTPELAWFSLLGRNYAYSVYKEISQDKSNYTSICFAWGYFDESTNKYERLSDFSLPIIFDRDLVTKTTNSSSKANPFTTTIELNKYKIIENSGDFAYYDYPAILILKDNEISE